jgi:hypothetical protein
MLKGMGLQLELFYSFIIISSSLMIYFGTKEIYELTNHKGIKYFRQTFLFFAIAYFFRSFIKLLFIQFQISKILTLNVLGPITLLLFIYFSSIAIFYLLYSVMWKKWNSKKLLLLHFLAILLAIITLLGNSISYLGINLLLLLFLIFTIYKSKKKSKHKILYLNYILLSIFWVLNILDILIPNFLKTFQLIIYFASTIVFLTILYKVLKNSGN